MPRTAVVTGASSRIGAATARHLAEAGFRVMLGARRVDRLRSFGAEIGMAYGELDVTDPDSVETFCEAIDTCDVLVNNAGGAVGLDSVESGDLDQWRTMYKVNVLGTVRMTQALLSRLEASGDGHVVVVGSIAGVEAYPGGGGYNAARFAEHAVRDVLRQELLGRPVRVTEIAPGLVETEFSTVRFGGDEVRAAQVYEA